MATYCLFAGRHELPANEGQICESFDFTTKKVVKTKLWLKAVQNFCDGEDVSILVTGLTPALTEFISHLLNLPPEDFKKGSLVLLHYDSSNSTYWEQRVI
jgi:hypothetical protein